MPTQYFMPVKVLIGAGLSRQMGEHVRMFRPNRILIVTDRGILGTGLLGPIADSLREAGIPFAIFDGVEPNPSVESIYAGLSVYKEQQCDAVLSIGGGSSIDTAKSISILATNDGHILDYEGIGKIPHKGVPHIAVPTTAGTGSEVTAATIVTNKAISFKLAVISPYLFPDLAILDPELTLRLPQEVTAATGMDALTHAIESYTSKAANAASQSLALGAIRMIGSHIVPAFYQGTNMESREQMLVASMLAGAAFAQSRLGNVHAISHTLGGLFDIPHGIANATLLPYVMRFNLPACPVRMKDIAVALGEDVMGLSSMEGGQKALDAVLRMNDQLFIPRTIKELGVDLSKLDKMVEDAMRSGNVLINPRLTRAEDIRTIIENAYHGVV